MFLKLKSSSIIDNTSAITKSSIWNTLIPSHPELPYDIDNFDDSENTEEDDDDNEDDDDDKDDELSLVPVESEEANHMCWIEAFQFPCATTWKHRANQKQYNQIYIVWFCLNGFLFGLEWIRKSHNFSTSWTWVKMRVPEKLAS